LLGIQLAIKSSDVTPVVDKGVATVGKFEAITELKKFGNRYLGFGHFIRHVNTSMLGTISRCNGACLSYKDK
jgi:hypothetical protein